MPGAVERLRDLRDAPPDEGPHALVLGAADPAQPYGAAVPWPRREGAARSPSRVFGAQVVLVDGAPSSTWSAAAGACSPSRPTTAPGPERAVEALAAWITSDRRRKVSGRARRRRAGLRLAARAPLADAGFRRPARDGPAG